MTDLFPVALKYEIMENFISFCAEYKIIGRFNPSDMSFSLCSASLGWVDISYSELSIFRPDLFPVPDPVQTTFF